MLDCLHLHVIFSSRMGSKNFEDRGGGQGYKFQDWGIPLLFLMGDKYPITCHVVENNTEDNRK